MTGQILTTFIKWILLHAAGLVSQVYMFDRCFARRHGMAVWLAYFGIRGVIRAYLSAAMAAGEVSVALLTFDVIFIAVTAVASFVVLWYTWDAEPLKIGMAAIMTDLITGVAMVISVGTVNLAAGCAFTPALTTLDTLRTAAAGAGLIALVLVMVKLLGPVIRWFRAAEFRHRGILTAVVIICAGMFSTTNLTDTSGFDSSIYIVCVTAALLLIPLALYGIKTIGMERDRRMLLRQQTGMNSAYILAVKSQADTIESHRQLLDEVAARIDSSERSLTNEELRGFTAELRARADRLRSGSYSSSLAVDAVLTAFAGRFEQLGFDTEFRTGALGSDDARAAEISWVILNWAEAAAASEVKKNSDGGVSAAGSVSYNIIRSGNQLIFSAAMTGAGMARFPERRLRGYIGRADVIQQGRRGGAYELRVMTEAA